MEEEEKEEEEEERGMGGEETAEMKCREWERKRKVKRREIC